MTARRAAFVVVHGTAGWAAACTDYDINAQGKADEPVVPGILKECLRAFGSKGGPTVLRIYDADGVIRLRGWRAWAKIGVGRGV